MGKEERIRSKERREEERSKETNAERLSVISFLKDMRPYFKIDHSLTLSTKRS